MREFTTTKIRYPRLLIAAVDFINSQNELCVVEARFDQDAEGNVKGGCFNHGGKGDNCSACVQLSFVPMSAATGEYRPRFAKNGKVLNGHFTLVGKQGNAATPQLSLLLSDMYSSQVIKCMWEDQGQEVTLSYNEDGGILVEGIDISTQQVGLF